MTSNFDDKSGIVFCKTLWGYWYQGMEDVTAQVTVPANTRGRDVTVKIGANKLSCIVHKNSVFSGDLFRSVVVDESTWTIEDEDGKKIIRIFLVKSDKTPKSCWSSLLKDQYPADPVVFDTMQKKMLQERYQTENPGFDFSGAEVTGNYQGGGPNLDS